MEPIPYNLHIQWPQRLHLTGADKRQEVVSSTTTSLSDMKMNIVALEDNQCILHFFIEMTIKKA